MSIVAVLRNSTNSCTKSSPICTGEQIQSTNSDTDYRYSTHNPCFDVWMMTDVTYNWDESIIADGIVYRDGYREDDTKDMVGVRYTILIPKSTYR